MEERVNYGDLIGKDAVSQQCTVFTCGREKRKSFAGEVCQRRGRHCLMTSQRQLDVERAAGQPVPLQARQTAEQ